MDIISSLQKKNIIGDIISEETQVTSLGIENQHIKSLEHKEVSGAGLRGLVNGKEAFVYSSSLNKDMIDKLVDISSLGSEENYQLPQQSTDIDSEIFFDLKIEDVNTEQVIQQGLELTAALNQKYPEYAFDFGQSYGKTKTKFINTSGLEFSYDKSFAWASIFAKRSIGKEILQFGESIQNKSGIFNYSHIVQPLEHTIQLLQQPKYKTNISYGQYPIIFHPRAFSSLINVLLTGINGKLFYQNLSPLQNKIGSIIAPEFLSILDDPLNKDMLGSQPYDDEGIVTKVKPIIHKGVFTEPIYNIKYASKMGLESTGHGNRGTQSLPGISTHNLIINTGSRDFQELIREISHGFYIIDFLGAGQSNILAGDISSQIGLGFIVKNGEIQGQVKDIMLHGNIFTMIMQLKELSLNRKYLGGAYYPYALFDNLEIIG